MAGVRLHDTGALLARDLAQRSRYAMHAGRSSTLGRIATWRPSGRSRASLGTARSNFATWPCGRIFQVTQAVRSAHPEPARDAAAMASQTGARGCRGRSIDDVIALVAAMKPFSGSPLSACPSRWACASPPPFPPAQN